MFGIILIGGMCLSVFGGNKQELADHKEQSDRSDADQQLPGMHLFDDQLPCDGEGEDLHNRIKGLVQQYMDQLDCNDNIDNIFKESDQTLGVNIRAAQQLLGQAQKRQADCGNDGDGNKTVQDIQETVHIFLKKSVDGLFLRIAHESLLDVDRRIMIN